MKKDEVRRPEGLLLDELVEQLERARRLLTAGPEEAADRTLEALGGPSEVEARITADLASIQPLAHPDRFGEAHRFAVRALEVLDREGFSEPPVKGFGPLNGLARPAVEFVAEYIVRSHASSVASRLHELYVRREAQAPPGSGDRRLLAGARVEMARIAAGLSGGGLGGPLLLAGGAAVPLLAGLGNVLGHLRLSSLAAAALLAFLAVFFYALSTTLLQGAAVARRRARLITAQPLAAVWETVGWAGGPPGDNATTVAVVALLLTAAAWLMLPAIGVAAYLLS